MRVVSLPVGEFAVDAVLGGGHAGVAHGGQAERVQVRHGGGQRGAAVVVRVGRDHLVDQGHGLVDQHAGGLPSASRSTRRRPGSLVSRVMPAACSALVLSRGVAVDADQAHRAVGYGGIQFGGGGEAAQLPVDPFQP